MSLSSRNIFFSFLVSGSVAAVVIACGSDGSTFDDGAPPPSFFGEGGFTGDGSTSTSTVDLYKKDPLPGYCGPDQAAKPPPITGSEECPDDKNKPGCGCATAGETAPCWEGFRRHRGLGICTDGVATCQRKSETLNVWGECVGQVLPKVGGKGAEACSCFSAGTWNIANTSPCLYRDGAGTFSAFSTIGDNGSGCTGNGVPNTANWSSDTLQVDCEGTFKLCFKVRAGDFKNPKADDCVLGEACVDTFYSKRKELQKLADLPAWTGKNSACAKKWEDPTVTPPTQSPGYGEMIVKGESITCDKIDDGSGGDFVFHRVQYCPRVCRPGNSESAGGYQPNLQACKDCQLAGTGDF